MFVLPSQNFSYLIENFLSKENARDIFIKIEAILASFCNVSKHFAIRYPIPQNIYLPTNNTLLYFNKITDKFVTIFADPRGNIHGTIFDKEVRKVTVTGIPNKINIHSFSNIERAKKILKEQSMIKLYFYEIHVSLKLKGGLPPDYVLENIEESYRRGDISEEECRRRIQKVLEARKNIIDPLISIGGPIGATVLSGYTLLGGAIFAGFVSLHGYLKGQDTDRQLKVLEQVIKEKKPPTIDQMQQIEKEIKSLKLNVEQANQIMTEINQERIKALQIAKSRKERLAVGEIGKQVFNLLSLGFDGETGTSVRVCGHNFIDAAMAGWDIKDILQKSVWQISELASPVSLMLNCIFKCVAHFVSKKQQDAFAEQIQALSQQTLELRKDLQKELKALRLFLGEFYMQVIEQFCVVHQKLDTLLTFQKYYFKELEKQAIQINKKLERNNVSYYYHEFEQQYLRGMQNVNGIKKHDQVMTFITSIWIWAAYVSRERTVTDSGNFDFSSTEITLSLENIINQPSHIYSKIGYLTNLLQHHFSFDANNNLVNPYLWSKAAFAVIEFLQKKNIYSFYQLKKANKSLDWAKDQLETYKQIITNGENLFTFFQKISINYKLFQQLIHNYRSSCEALEKVLPSGTYQKDPEIDQLLKEVDSSFFQLFAFLLLGFHESCHTDFYFMSLLGKLGKYTNNFPHLIASKDIIFLLSKNKDPFYLAKQGTNQLEAILKIKINANKKNQTKEHHSLVDSTLAFLYQIGRVLYPTMNFFYKRTNILLSEAFRGENISKKDSLEIFQFYVKNKYVTENGSQKNTLYGVLTKECLQALQKKKFLIPKKYKKYKTEIENVFFYIAKEEKKSPISPVIYLPKLAPALDNSFDHLWKNGKLELLKTLNLSNIFNVKYNPNLYYPRTANVQYFIENDWILCLYSTKTSSYSSSGISIERGHCRRVTTTYKTPIFNQVKAYNFTTNKLFDNIPVNHSTSIQNVQVIQNCLYIFSLDKISIFSLTLQNTDLTTIPLNVSAMRNPVYNDNYMVFSVALHQNVRFPQSGARHYQYGLKIIDLKKKQCIKTISVPARPNQKFLAIELYQNTLIYGDSNGSICVWDIPGEKNISTFSLHKRSCVKECTEVFFIRCVNNRVFISYSYATSSSSRGIKSSSTTDIWDIKKGTFIQTLDHNYRLLYENMFIDSKNKNTPIIFSNISTKILNFLDPLKLTVRSFSFGLNELALVFSSDKLLVGQKKYLKEIEFDLFDVEENKKMHSLKVPNLEKLEKVTTKSNYNRVFIVGWGKKFLEDMLIYELIAPVQIRSTDMPVSSDELEDNFSFNPYFNETIDDIQDNQWYSPPGGGNCLFDAFRIGCEYLHLKNAPANAAEARRRCVTRLTQYLHDKNFNYNNNIAGELSQAILPQQGLDPEFDSFPLELRTDLLLIQSFRGKDKKTLTQEEQQNERRLREKYNFQAPYETAAEFINGIFKCNAMLGAYLNAIGQNGVWGGGTELKSLSDGHRVRIRVLNTTTNEEVEYNQERNEWPLIELRRAHGNHYHVKILP